MTDDAPRWSSAIWSIMEARPHADQILWEVYRRLSMGSEALTPRPVTAETFLTDVLLSFSEDLRVRVEKIYVDQWFGITGKRGYDEDEERFFVQCDEPQFGLAWIWKHYADLAGLAVDDADSSLVREEP